MKTLLTMVAVATVIAAPAFAKTRHQASTTNSPTAHYSGQRPADVRTSAGETAQRSQSSDTFGNWVPPTPSPY